METIAHGIAGRRCKAEDDVGIACDIENLSRSRFVPNLGRTCSIDIDILTSEEKSFILDELHGYIGSRIAQAVRFHRSLPSPTYTNPSFPVEIVRANDPAGRDGEVFVGEGRGSMVSRGRLLERPVFSCLADI
jgi:hypothetical protein